MQYKENFKFDDRYLLKKLLGRGGFSEVWLVEDTRVGNIKMALKVYAPGMGLDDDGVRLFSSEFELVFNLNHPNLLRPSHFDIFEHSPYLVMPYCERNSAAKIVGRISVDEAWRFLHDVAAGLAYLHEQPDAVIHQDIKPDNVLIDQAGNYLITDFGISSKARSTLRKSAGNIKSGGTLAYMSPERFGKNNTPGKAGDIWALGATLFELITGQVPFGDHGGLIQKSGAELPDTGNDCPRDLQEIIIRCMQMDADERPTAQQIVEWTQDHDTKKKLKFDSGVKRKLRSKKIRIAAGACVAGIIIVALTVSYFSSPTTKDPSREQTGNSASNQNPESLQTNTIATTTETPANLQTSAVKAWETDYETLLDNALSAFIRKDYAKAKADYEKAYKTATENSDRQKAAFVAEQILKCDNAIKDAAETRKREVQERLAQYDFLDRFLLGNDFMIVQQKSNYRWGIINKEGVVKETFSYSDMSPRLKNGYYALKNEQGWVVFDVKATKIAGNLANLDEYR